MNTADFITIFSNPTITAIVGAIVGGLATFFPMYAIEVNHNKQFKRNIKKLLKVELIEYQKFLENILQYGAYRLNDHNFVHLFNQELHERMKILVTSDGRLESNYELLSPETKGKIFDERTLTILEETYRHLENYRINGMENLSHGYVYFSKKETDTLLNSIKKAIPRL